MQERDSIKPMSLSFAKLRLDKYGGKDLWQSQILGKKEKI